MNNHSGSPVDGDNEQATLRMSQTLILSFRWSLGKALFVTALARGIGGSYGPSVVVG